MINRKTSLANEKLIKYNYKKFKYILEKFQQKDPILLDQLQYYYSIKKSEQDLDEAIN